MERVVRGAQAAQDLKRLVLWTDAEEGDELPQLAVLARDLLGRLLEVGVARDGALSDGVLALCLLARAGAAARTVAIALSSPSHSRGRALRQHEGKKKKKKKGETAVG